MTNYGFKIQHKLWWYRDHFICEHQNNIIKSCDSVFEKYRIRRIEKGIPIIIREDVLKSVLSYMEDLKMCRNDNV